MSEKSYPPNAGKTWLLAERQALRERFAEGKSIEVIAVEHGRTAGAIIGKLLEMGLVIQNRDGFYFKVNPDPWCSYHDVRHHDKGE